MANTKTSTLSIRLHATAKQRLTRLAEASGRSSNALVADAVDNYLDDQERLHATLRKSEQDMKHGHYVPHADMKAWLLSWGTGHELPPPTCICGHSHEGAPHAGRG